ncbi:MAG: hypothetical protein KY467_03330 [Gemmatimonadetes bacterium]|nr:hypothetical protein [Gemmatimonadota bacterium]
MRSPGLTTGGIRLLLLLWAVLAGGCRGAKPAVVEGPAVEVLARVEGQAPATITASPTGRLYLTLGTTLYRLRDGAHPLDTVAELGAVATVLHAPAEDEVLLLVQSSPEIVRWRAGHGIESMATPVKDSVFMDGHYMDRINLMDLWGTSPREVYAVGDHATILRYDRRQWSLEANPLLEYAGRGAPLVYRSYLWSVGGDSQAVYAAAASSVLSRENGTWSRLRVPDADSIYWVLALGAPGGSYLVGRDAATREQVLFYRAAGGAWLRLPGLLQPLRYEPLRGRGQPEGSVVFWTIGGEVVRLVGKRATIFKRLGLASITGAAVSGHHLYVVGARYDSTVLLRLNL